ncbi:kinase-like domain-containing protein [Mycena polygramma]|nr:kinase-like domain-containing protein [Mycena polygramma]
MPPTLAITAPFGSWPKDLNWELIQPPRGTMPLSISGLGRVDLLPEHGVVTKLMNNTEDVERVWDIMQLAGDCSVSVVGRLFFAGSFTGFCMPIETPIDPKNIGSKEERVRIIYQLRDLLAELHKKNIVHGDVKPQNLLMCADGRVRFCDFDNASVEGDGFSSSSITYPYCSASRARNGDEPMTRAEDMYAMGVSMWHIYTGKLPLILEGETEDPFNLQGILIDRTPAGFMPDMARIDDPEIASLITACRDAGPDRPDAWDSGQAVYCIETHFVFGRCGAEPKHTYSRIIHSGFCLDRGTSTEPCEYPFLDPKVFTSPLEPICVKCNVGVEYIGLGERSDTGCSEVIS